MNALKRTKQLNSGELIALKRTRPLSSGELRRNVEQRTRTGEPWKTNASRIECGNSVRRRDGNGTPRRKKKITPREITVAARSVGVLTVVLSMTAHHLTLLQPLILMVTRAVVGEGVAEGVVVDIEVVEEVHIEKVILNPTTKCRVEYSSKNKRLLS